MDRAIACLHIRVLPSWAPWLFPRAKTDPRSNRQIPCSSITSINLAPSQIQDRQLVKSLVSSSGSSALACLHSSQPAVKAPHFSLQAPHAGDSEAPLVLLTVGHTAPNQAARASWNIPGQNAVGRGTRPAEKLSQAIMRGCVILQQSSP